MRRVVVTGLGAISPVGNQVDAFWNGLISGKNGIDFITKFDTSNYKVKIAGEVKDFDPLKYMEKAEARKQDLFSQYAIAAAVQAVEDAGITEENTDPARLGVYVGSGTGGMSTFFDEAQKLLSKGPNRISPFFIPMMIGNMATGNIAIRFHAQGPSLPIVTACATSTNAIGEAFRTIKFGYADAIIAGGTEATIVPLAVAGFTNCMALTQKNDPDASSIPFDKNRDGFVMGEGAAILILEEYEHAINRGANIYAEMVGYGNTNDAYHMTAPHPEAMGGAKAISLALDEAATLDPALMKEDRIYINAHGTSTPLNDKTETKAIKLALGEEKAKKVYISSTKSMTGHMLGAAGAIEAAATVLALKNGKIPPTIGYKEMDPECDLNYTPNKSVDADVKLGMSISLGFGGHNGCIAFRKIEE
ncbi:beta-ketoacyl-ACP synthase II [Anaerovorax sp. IOR16]|uniref:beta-ketoacyl-ACP synthase II n=1 Tax=Anaerovorax sp. IOR16 TaxID=2773458 RepID=UPI0019D15F79|nr:beta-ketoacyl-ACP synthase II [Anaerovorax sp. IOR16]